MKWYFNRLFLGSQETVFYSMIAVGVIMVVLTVIFVAKEIKENNVNK